VIFAWKRGSQASSLRENGSFGLSGSDASGGGANLTTKRVPRETVNTSLRASAFQLAMKWRGRAGRVVAVSNRAVSNWRSSEEGRKARSRGALR